MVPLRQVFDKVSRVVRRLRTELGKEVRFEVHGADTELDKLIVEALVDPLMHIVRNSLDHAIEPADERRAAGKAPEGRVRIGELVRVRPAHVDPTVAYHERMHLVSRDEVLESWEVDLRGW